MKKYVYKRSGVTYDENHVLGTWPDGSDKTISELVGLDPESWEEFKEPDLEKDLNERFQFTKDLMLSLARGGVTPSPEYMMEKVKYLFDNKSKLK